MKIGIDGSDDKWYRGTGFGTYNHELIRRLNNTHSNKYYLVFMQE